MVKINYYTMVLRVQELMLMLILVAILRARLNFWWAPRIIVLNRLKESLMQNLILLSNDEW